MGRPVSVGIAGVKLAYTCTGSTFLIFCTHLCFLPWLDLTSLCEAEESHLFWWGFRVLASPLEGIRGTSWVRNHEGPGHTKQKGLLRRRWDVNDSVNSHQALPVLDTTWKEFFGIGEQHWEHKHFTCFLGALFVSQLSID